MLCQHIHSVHDPFQCFLGFREYTKVACELFRRIKSPSSWILHLQIYFYFEVSARNYNDRSSGVTNFKFQLKMSVYLGGYEYWLPFKYFSWTDREANTFWWARQENQGWRKACILNFFPLFKCLFKSLSVMLPSI